MRLFPLLMLSLGLLCLHTQARTLGILYGPPSHGYGEHMHEENMELLRSALELSEDITGLEVFAVGPEDPFTLETLERANSFVILCDGGADHVVFQSEERIQIFDTLMQQGKGLVCIHFATSPNYYLKPENEAYEQLMMGWLGGTFSYTHDTVWPVHYYETEVAEEGHPIGNGVGNFSFVEELYHQMRFPQPLPAGASWTPVLTSSIPHAQPPVQTVAWAFQRGDGGRAFAFTGGHFYTNWSHEDFRQVVINGIVWTLGMDVPEDGITTTLHIRERKLLRSMTLRAFRNLQPR